MMAPQQHTIHKENIRYNYLVFDSVRAFNRFVDAETERLNYSNANTWKHQVIETELMISKGTEWFGTPMPKGIADLDNHDYFLGMHLLKELQPKIKDQMAQYLNYLNIPITNRNPKKEG